MTRGASDRGARNFATTAALAVRLETLRRWYRREGAFGFEVLGADAADGRRVLEIGPGDGRHAAEFLRRTGATPRSWTLLDRSEAMAAAARDALPRRARARAVLGDADRLPLSRGARFDLVVAMHVLMFVARPRRVLRELAARLAPGGRLVITTATHDMPEIRRPARDALRAHGAAWRHVTTDYPAPRAERDLRALFRRVVLHPQRGAIEFPDSGSAVRYLRSLPWFDGAPVAALDDAIFRVRAAAERAVAAHGVFRVTKGGATFVASEPVVGVSAGGATRATRHPR